MKLTFLGIGEAFDTQEPNTSLLLEQGSNLLFDCGYNIPQQLWKINADPNFLDIIYISHFHADHYFGLAPLLQRMKEEKRKSPLTIITQRGGKTKIAALLKMAYKQSLLSLGFKVHFVEVKHGSKIKVNAINFEFARMIHAIPTLAVKVILSEKNNERTLIYTGDGMSLKNTLKFYENADLLVHEAYTPEKEIRYHSTIEHVLTLAKEANIKKVALVHINRNIRQNLSFLKEQVKTLKERLGYQQKVILPRALQVIEQL